MAIVLAALMPVFLLIVLGFVLKRSVMRLGDYSAGCYRPRGGWALNVGSHRKTEKGVERRMNHNGQPG
jgi:hypothetical protein